MSFLARVKEFCLGYPTLTVLFKRLFMIVAYFWLALLVLERLDAPRALQIFVFYVGIFFAVYQAAMYRHRPR